MKQYLKMADVFVHDSVEELEQHIYAGYVSKHCSEYAAHAINSHDELVQMNQELLAALESVIEWYDMEADHLIEPDFYKRMAACQVSEAMAREAIAKAKGGAA